MVRLGLALALLATTWTVVDGNYPAHAAAQSFAAGYLLLSLMLLVITWQSWWLTHRLRLVSLLLDGAVLFAALAIPGLPPAAVAGVFMALYVFMLISAALCCPKRGTLVTALVLVIGFCATCAFLDSPPGYSAWFGPQIIGMIALAGLLIWLGQRIGKPRPPRLDVPHDGSLPSAFQAVLDFAVDQAEATGGALAWVPDDEPWVWVQSTGTLGETQVRLGPDQFALSAQEPPVAVLFNRTHRRQLYLQDSGMVAARKGALVHPLILYFHADCGIMVSVPAHGGTCHLLLTGVHDLAVDHLRLLRAVGVEIGHALDRRAVMMVTREADRIRIRDALARDLHDSVAQSLAGASFRIEALRVALNGGRAIDADLDALQRSFEQEERHVQRLILQLRDRDEPDRPCDLAQELAATLDDSGARWGVDCSLTATGDLPLVPLLALHEFEQILREAVANAVRHGNANRVEVHLHRREGQIMLDIADDGQGFPGRPRPLRPRSIASRVADMNGWLNIQSQPGNTRLQVVLPDRWTACRGS